MPVNNVWKFLSEAHTEEVTLPSGQIVVAKKLGIEQVLAAGLSSELDIMTNFVVNEHLDHKKPQDRKKSEAQLRQDQIEAVMKNPQMLGKLIMYIDKLMPEVVVEPDIHTHFKVLEDGKSTKMLSKEDRQKINEEAGVEYLYTDKLPFEDKMYLFQYTTGAVVDPVTFREGPADTVEGMANVQTVQRSSQRPSRRRRR